MTRCRIEHHAKLEAENARMRGALLAVTDHLASVMAGPLVAGRGVTFADGVEGIPTIKAARAALARESYFEERLQARPGRPAHS